MQKDDFTQKTGDDATFPPPPTFLEGEALYDFLMGPIESELMSTQKETVVQRYENETPEQTKVRNERYTKAFAEYDRQYAAYQEQQKNTVKNYKRQLMGGVEERATKHEQDDVSSLESQMNNS